MGSAASASRPNPGSDLLPTSGQLVLDAPAFDCSDPERSWTIWHQKPWLCKRVMALDANEWAARFGSKDSGDENGVAHARTADVETRDCFESSLS